MLWAILGSVLIAFGVVALFVTSDAWVVLLQLVPGVLLLGVAAVTSAAEIRNRLASDSSRRGLLFGSNALVQTAALLALLAGCAYLAKKPALSKEWDWTEGGVHSLAKASVDTLARIPEDGSIQAYAFFLDPAGARDLLDLYKSASPRFSYQIINPNRDLAKAQTFEITGDETIVLCKGPCEVESSGESAIPGGTERAPTRVTLTEPSEEKLTQAIRSVISEKRKVYFLAGHEEGDPDDDQALGMAQAKKALEGENTEVAKHALATDPTVPKDADALILAGPTRPLLESETAALDAYLRGGGSLLVMIDPATDTELEKTLEGWGIKLGADVIVDQQLQLFGPPQLVLQANTMEYGQHPVTRDMEGRLTSFRLARSVEPLDANSTDVVKLVETGPGSYAAGDVASLKERGTVRLDPEKDRQGPISIAVARSFPAAAAEPPKEGEEPKPEGTEDQPAAREGRLVVVGDADFARNQGFGRSYNNDLLLSMANWLVGEEEFITIDRKVPRASSVEMSMDQVYTFSYLAIFALPEALILLGIAQWWRRRRS